METVVRGAIAGVAGTAVMSAFMAADRSIGWMRGEAPPRKIGRNFERAVGLEDDLSQPAFEASWTALHFAYGAAGGVAYEVIRRRVRLGEPLPSGPLFGAALWAASYAGWLPLAGFYPPPTRDRPSRITMIFVHHLIYGTSVAAAARYLRSRSASPGQFAAEVDRSEGRRRSSRMIRSRPESIAAPASEPR